MKLVEQTEVATTKTVFTCLVYREVCKDYVEPLPVVSA